jgi:hypothetical protein
MTFPAFPDNLGGFTVAVCSALVGGKKAIIQGRTVYVSPAMFDLMMYANEEELKRLLNSIEAVEIPEFDPFNLDLPMMTTPPL